MGACTPTALAVCMAWPLQGLGTAPPRQAYLSVTIMCVICYLA